MDRTAAELAVKAETDWLGEPPLSESDIAHCLSFAAVPDITGIYPDEDDYIETYTRNTLNAAYATAMRMKANKLGAAKDVTTVAGDSQSPDLRRRYFLDAAKDYESRLHGSFKAYPWDRLRNIEAYDGVIVN